MDTAIIQDFKKKKSESPKLCVYYLNFRSMNAFMHASHKSYASSRMAKTMIECPDSPENDGTASWAWIPQWYRITNKKNWNPRKFAFNTSIANSRMYVCMHSMEAMYQEERQHQRLWLSFPEIRVQYFNRKFENMSLCMHSEPRVINHVKWAEGNTQVS